MGGKAKFTKHTQKELQAKLDAQKSKGGGKAGSASRTACKLNFTCEICKSSSPDIKSFQFHYESKHPKTTFDRDAEIKKAEALKEASTPKVAGSHHNGGRK